MKSSAMDTSHCSIAIEAILLLLISSSMAYAAIVEHVFHVQNMVAKPLCKEQIIPTVNGSLPGPTINVRDGDTLVVHVINNSTYNTTIHWHGIFQLRSSWMDGASMVTQCPIKPGNNFTYRFKITGQEGTLMWHTHVDNLRATVHGPLIIRPKVGRPYPFPKPYKEIPIVFEQWWNVDLNLLEKQPAPICDAYLINGLAGDSNPCSKHRMFKVKVVKGKTYLLRIINAALNTNLFFKIANHNMTVVALDAVYTTPYITDVIILTPGQTVDSLFAADQTIGSYYMAIKPYITLDDSPYSSSTTRALIIYEGATSSSLDSPMIPSMPDSGDTHKAHKFLSNITSLIGGPNWTPVPRHVDEKMFMTVGLGLDPCPLDTKCIGPYHQLYSASVNNISYVQPKTLSLQQAYFHNITGIYTDDFPNQPPSKFDYVNFRFTIDSEYKMMFPEKKTSVKMLKFNSTVEIVMQNTALLFLETHPMHLHGFNFHVLGQGFGNYDPTIDARKLNLVNPQMRNTVAIPHGGWIVLRFVANNPGVWLFHCHMDRHMNFGMVMAFIVQNGPTPATSLPPPPSDLPECSRNPEIYNNPTTYIDSSS